LLCKDPSLSVPSTLSLHDALPIWSVHQVFQAVRSSPRCWPVAVVKTLRTGSLASWILWLSRSTWATSFCSCCWATRAVLWASTRSEEHTSELQSRFDLVCRLLLEK